MPGVSRKLRRIDPRVKLLQILAVAFTIFMVNSPMGIACEVAALAVCLFYLGLYREGAMLILVFGGAQFLLMVFGEFSNNSVISMLAVVLMLMRKLSPAIGVFMLATRSMEVSELIAGLEKLRLPKALVLALAVALRFLPTVQVELAAVGDSLKTRGRSLSFLNFVRAPVAMSENVLVPFMMRSSKIADELSASAVCRGIEAPGTRTSRYELKYSFVDGAYFLFVCLTTAAVLVLEIAG